MIPFDIDPGHLAYIYGLIQTDGHYSSYSRNRGRISIELSERDKDILFKIEEILPVSCTISTRTRQTNFKPSSTTFTLNIFDYDFRMMLEGFGLSPGKKSSSIKPPDFNTHNLIERDYWRGVIDGDGSLGFTKYGIPFISLVSKSDELIESYKDLIKIHCDYRPITKRNKRNDAYNVTVFRQSPKLIERLYPPNCLGIDRKIKLAQMITFSTPLNLP